LTERLIFTTEAEIHEWAANLAGETREPDYVYFCPEEMRELSLQLSFLQNAIVGLVGQQGIGKSSVLIELSRHPIYTPKGGSQHSDRVLFKWRSQPQLFDVFLDPNSLAYEEFVLRYAERLYDELDRLANTKPTDQTDNARPGVFLDQIKHSLSLPHRESFDLLDVDPKVKALLELAESQISKQFIQKSRRDAWFETITTKKLILIDTSDYSKTDKRRMDRDLSEIYWLWNKLASDKNGTIIIVAIQKEMFHDHFFLDKMQLTELKPLSTEQLLEAYTKRFGNFVPFTPDSIKLLAQMSRGIFRRFLRYITLTLNDWEINRETTETMIHPQRVKHAVTIEHLTKDLENELTTLFRNSSQQRTLAIKTITLLWENKEIKQSTLTKQLETQPFTISRILTTLENAKYITHRHDGKEKIITYKESENIL